MPQLSRPSRPTWLLALLILMTIAAACLIVIDLGMMMMSPMLFDAGESSMAWAVFIGVWLFPFVEVMGMAIGWIGFAARARWAAIVGLVVAIAPVIAAACVFLGA